MRVWLAGERALPIDRSNAVPLGAAAVAVPAPPTRHAVSRVTSEPQTADAAPEGDGVTILAHAGHWAVQLLYLLPLVVLVWVLVASRLRERRQRESGREESE